jgi:hypothetical protein
MFGMRIRLPYIVYAAIDPGGSPGGGGMGAAPPGSPTPPAQPGSQGGGQGGGFREQFFPNVPDDQWALMEPHVSNVNRHVTQLQQRYAPFKSYRDEDLQGLANFATSFDRDPVGQWLRMAQALQANGHLDTELDLEHLGALVQGTLPDAGGNQSPPNGDGEMPAWAQQLNQRLDKLEGGVTDFQTSQRQQVEDAVLQRQINAMKAGLKKAGFADNSVTQEQLLSAYIAHRGNAQAALESFVNLRNNLLQGFTRTAGGHQPAPNNGGNNDLDLPGGAPPVRAARGGARRGSGAIDSKTKAAAEQFLRSQEV